LACDYRTWNNNPEKVLGVNEEWAGQYPRTHLALVRALLEALRWFDEPANRPQPAAVFGIRTPQMPG
jgi:nitrate/nitrite transport system substrate-binding protein